MAQKKQHSEQMHVAWVPHQRKGPEDNEKPGDGKSSYLCLLLSPVMREKCLHRLGLGNRVCVIVRMWYGTPSAAKGQRPSHRPSIHDGLHLVGKPIGQAFTDPGALAWEMTRGRPSVAPGAACSESTLFRAHHQPLPSSNRQPMRTCVQCGEGLQVTGAQDQVGVVSLDTHSSILSGKPQQWRGSLSPCPV